MTYENHGATYDHYMRTLAEPVKKLELRLNDQKY